MKRRLLSCLSALVILLSGAPLSANAVTVEAVETRIGDQYLIYPQLKGLQDPAVEERINGDIATSSDVARLLVTLLTLQPDDRLQLDYEVCLMDDKVFSAVINHQGKRPQNRNGQKWIALTYDLQTGERLTLDQLFTDPDEAVARMEEIAETTLSEELSGYMEYSDLLPLPVDSFTLDENGITFWYPEDQFSFFSGFSGACQFWYEELEGLWLEEHTEKRTDDELRKAIEESVTLGRLPKVPVAMGQSMQEVCTLYRLLRTPDQFPGGRYFVMEDPKLRQVVVLSDHLYDDYSRSVVEGIQLKRGGLYDFRIGQTNQGRWREVLGEPGETVNVTENMSYDYNLPVGQYDVYHYGGNELRLHADESGVLCAIQLCK